MNGIRVGRRRSLQCLRFGKLEGDDGRGVYEEGLAAVGGESVLDEVEEAATG